MIVASHAMIEASLAAEAGPPYRRIVAAFDSSLADAFRSRLEGSPEAADSALARCAEAAGALERHYELRHLRGEIDWARALSETGVRDVLRADSLSQAGTTQLAAAESESARASFSSAESLFKRAGHRRRQIGCAIQLLDPRLSERTPSDRAGALAPLQEEASTLVLPLIRGFAVWLRAGTLAEMGEVDRAIALFDSVRDIGVSFADVSYISRGYQGSSMALQRAGRWEEAKALSGEWHEVASAWEDTNGMIRALQQISNIFHNESRLDSSIAYSRASLDLSERSGSKQGIAYQAYGLCLDLWYIQEHEEALAHCERARTVAHEVRIPVIESNAINVIGNIYGDHGDWKRALPLHREALGIAERQNDYALQTYALTNIGIGLINADSLREARAYLERGLIMADSVPESEREWDQKGGTLGQMAWLSSIEGDTAAAIRFARASYALATDPSGSEYDRNLGVCSAGEELGYLLLSTDDIAGAESVFTAMVAAATALGHKRQLGFGYGGLGEVRWRKGEKDKALEDLDRAIATLEERREALGSIGVRESWFGASLRPFETMVRYQIELGRPDEAFAYYERMKARELLDLLAGGRVVTAGELDPAERAEEEALVERVEALNRQMANGETISHEEMRLAANALADFEEQLFRAHEGLRERRGRGRPIEAREACRLIAPDEVGLLYVLGSERATVLVVTRNGIEGRQLAATAREIRNLVGELRESLVDPGRPYSRKDAKALYEALIGPVREHVSGKRRVCIVPDGELYGLPFQALVDPVADRFFVEQHVSYVVPSLSALGALRWKGSRGRRDLLAFGDPDFGASGVVTTALRGAIGRLPGTAREVAEIAEVYAPRGKIFTGTEATERSFKETASDYGVLHIASHGMIDDAEPLHSCLVLAKSDTTEDGFLEAREVMKLSLDADIAILSACETAGGGQTRGEGMSGLTRAFFTAGVPTVVASLWPVQDESTARLMTGFHRLLRDGERPADALALAERALASSDTASLAGDGGASAERAIGGIAPQRPPSQPPRLDTDMRHPFFWAPFVLYGDSE